MSNELKNLKVFRRMFFIAGAVYGLWWFAVQFLLPDSFNPPVSRFLIVALCFGFFALSYASPWVRKHIQALFVLCASLITLHFYYLFYYNAGDINWVVGAFITVTAIGFGILSMKALLAYSILVILISGIMVGLLPHLTHSVFFPGILTILIQANLGLRSRLGTIKTLADSNERFRLLFDSAFEGVVVHEKGAVTNVNEAILKMLDYTRNEVLGRPVMEFVHPDDVAMILEKMKVTEVAPYECRFIRKDKTIIEVEVRAKEFNYRGQVSRLAAVLDITDRKRAEKNRITIMAMAENLRSRDEFISIASHEFKTPISALRLQTQLIERAIKKDPTQSFSSEKLGEYASLFSRQVTRLSELVETMLNVSSIAAGKMSLNIEKMNLAQMVRDVVSLIHSPIPMNVVAAEEVEIFADQSRILQVIENLITNAIKYGNGKPVQIQVKVENEKAVLLVEDQGLGIAPEYIDRIFNRFERAISASNISGFGLGLYIVKKIVEAHQGQISVRSQLGQGSEFKVELPLKF